MDHGVTVHHAPMVTCRDRKDPRVSIGMSGANELEAAILREGPDTVAASIAELIEGGVINHPWFVAVWLALMLLKWVQMTLTVLDL